MRGIVIGIKSTSTASHITFDLYTHRKSAKKLVLKRENRRKLVFSFRNNLGTQSGT